MSEQCNWRIAHGIGWLVCQRERGHDPEKFPHVHATKVGESQIQGTWEQGPELFEFEPRKTHDDLFLP